MGPLGMLLKLAAKSSGKKMAKRVSKDLAAARQAASRQWTLDDKIHELETDSGVSPSYLRGLANDAADKEHLQAVRNYLFDPKKTANLADSELKSIAGLVHSKISLIEDQEALRELIKMAKELLF